MWVINLNLYEFKKITREISDDQMKFRERGIAIGCLLSPKIVIMAPVLLRKWESDLIEVEIENLFPPFSETHF